MEETMKFGRNKVALQLRRERSLARLESQLRTGSKTVKSQYPEEVSTIPLSDSDRKRIQKEIDILKSRI